MSVYDVNGKKRERFLCFIRVENRKNVHCMHGKCVSANKDTHTNGEKITARFHFRL